MTNVANHFLDYFSNASAAYNTNNQATGRSVNGWTPVQVGNFRASDPNFAAQLYSDGAGHYRVAIRGTDQWGLGGDAVALHSADGALALGVWQAQQADAIRFVGQAILQIKRQNENLSLNQIRALIDNKWGQTRIFLTY